MNQAAIDLGTNTCLLLIQNEKGRALHDESTIVRLGEGVALHQTLKPEAMERAKECLARYVEIAKFHQVPAEQVIAIGTAQARDARNAAAFFKSLETTLGIRFRILTGDEEAQATFLGAGLPGEDSKSRVVMDIGGGSTELVAMPDSSGKIFGQSLGIGAVKISELFLISDPVTDVEFWAAEASINDALKALKPWRNELSVKIKGEPRFTAVAGTAVTLAMLQLGMTKYDASSLEGVRLTRGDAHRLVEELKWRSVEERRLMPGMEPKRADVMLAGALIFWRVMESLDFHEAVISTRGLRYGVLDPRFS